MRMYCLGLSAVSRRNRRSSRRRGRSTADASASTPIRPLPPMDRAHRGAHAGWQRRERRARPAPRGLAPRAPAATPRRPAAPTPGRARAGWRRPARAIGAGSSASGTSRSAVPASDAPNSAVRPPGRKRTPIVATRGGACTIHGRDSVPARNAAGCRTSASVDEPRVAIAAVDDQLGAAVGEQPIRRTRLSAPRDR